MAKIDLVYERFSGTNYARNPRYHCTLITCVIWLILGVVALVSIPCSFAVHVTHIISKLEPVQLSEMASIMSSLGGENEARLQKLFSRPVRFHLMYKSSYHGVNLDQLLSSFDNRGKFVLLVFLQSGLVRGGYTSKSLKQGNEFVDTEAFLFEIAEGKTKHFPVLTPAKAVEICHRNKVTRGYPTVPTQSSLASISFGNCLQISFDNSRIYASFSKDLTYNTTWPEECNVCCVDVELHRVQDAGDTLSVPWREVSWTDQTRESLRQEFVSYKITPESLPRVKALLLGPVGSGKSSFINSIRSTMYRRVIHLPNVGSAPGGFTKKLTTYDIRAEKRGPLTALRLCDVMAVAEDDCPGLTLSNAMEVIKGHVPEGYKFSTDVPISDTESGYRAAPSLKEQIHCILFVLDATKVTSYPSSLKSTLRKLHTMISNLGIPQLIMLTHLDQVCLAVQKDVKYVYSSRTVQDKMQNAADLVGLPLSYVLPVNNYISQLSVNRNTDILLLNVVMSILNAVDDALEDQYPVNISTELL